MKPEAKDINDLRIAINRKITEQLQKEWYEKNVKPPEVPTSNLFKNIWSKLKTNYFSRMGTHYHYHFGADSNVLSKINKQLKQIKKIMAENQTELAGELATVNAQLAKINTEYTTRIASLEAALVAAGTITPEVQAELDALKAVTQAIDDVTPDAPAETPSEG